MNVFVQTQLKGCGLRVGTEDYRVRVKEVNQTWSAMSHDQRASFEQQAFEQQRAASALCDVALATKDVESIAAPLTLG